LKQRLINILFWSVISAAFIGPGTVTTAAAAGSGFGYTLIWALIFSTVACFVLQEASARLTAVSSSSLGEVMAERYSNTNAGKTLNYLALVAILSGCAAFETGNILGAAAGVSLISHLPNTLIVSAIGLISFLLLWHGSVAFIAKTLGAIVAFMGLCFISTAILIPQDPFLILSSSFIPSIPDGAEILVLGLIGTTVVPYNIFLGSGLKHTQTQPEMRISLLIAIGLGGLVSIAVLLTGSAITGAFSFDALSEALEGRLGTWAGTLLGLGLLGAGLSSTLTAALAASVTAKSILEINNKPGAWDEKGMRFRGTWIAVLLTGLIFGLIGLRPIPVIILAQALNGIILPVIAVILFLLINNNDVLPVKHQNGTIYNLFTGLIVYVSILIGLNNLARAASSAAGYTIAGQQTIFIISVIIFALLLSPLIKAKHHE